MIYLESLYILEINTNNKLEILNIRSLYPNSWQTQFLIYGVIIWNDLGLHDEIKKNISNYNFKNKPSNNICVVRLMAESRHFLSSTNLCQSTLLFCLLPYQFFIHSSSTFSRAYSADKSQLKIVCARFPPVAKAMIANKQNNPFKSTRARSAHIYFQQIRYERGNSHTVTANFCWRSAHTSATPVGPIHFLNRADWC